MVNEAQKALIDNTLYISSILAQCFAVPFSLEL